MTLGEKLAAARQAKGLTQAQAAGDVITRNMLSLLEHDQAEPSLSTLRHLARTLEVPLSWLLDGGGEALEAARTAFLAGDWKRCLDVLAAETAPLTEEGQLLRLRAALGAAREAWSGATRRRQPRCWIRPKAGCPPRPTPPPGKRRSWRGCGSGWPWTGASRRRISGPGRPLPPRRKRRGSCCWPGAPWPRASSGRLPRRCAGPTERRKRSGPCSRACWKQPGAIPGRPPPI